MSGIKYDSHDIRTATNLEGVTAVINNPIANILFSNAKNWVEKANLLREIHVECDLTEEIKWRRSCYTYNEKNTCIIQRMAGLLSLLFFKCVLLKDPDDLLEPNGLHSRAG